MRAELIINDMKTRFLIVVAALLALCLGASAQGFNRMMTRPELAGEIHFKDGTIEEYQIVYMPTYYEGRVKVLTFKDEEKVIPVSKIKELIFWNEEEPDRRFTLRYVPCKYPHTGDIWALLDYEGKYAAVNSVAWMFNVDKAGRIVAIYEQGYGAERVWYNAHKNAWLVNPKGKKVEKFYSDDPKLAADMKEQSRSAKYIVENYNPKK